MTTPGEHEAALAAAETYLWAGRAAEARQLCESALLIRPDEPKALLLLSLVSIMQSNVGDAEASLIRGCAVHPKLVAFPAALAQLRLQTLRFAEALEPLEQCVLLDPSNRQHRVTLLSIYQSRLFTGFSERSKRAMLACLLDDALSHWLIHRQWLSLVKLDRACAPLLELLSLPDYASFAARMAPAELLDFQDNEFLNAGLKRFLVLDLGLERGLGFTRRWLFEQRSEARQFLPLLCTLARYFSLSEYVLPATENFAALQMQPTTAAEAALLACYEPLLDHDENGGVAALSDLPCYRDLIALQLLEPLQEVAIRDGISASSPIVDDVSLAVRQQYEENPYPRWSSVGVVARESAEVNAQARGRRILIAGCGTGREAIEAALVFPEAKLEAIDLSRRSLAYGMRKARELGTSNLSFRQADLLNLGSAQQGFHLIVCSGVLHHLREPRDGLRALLGCLLPGGVLRIALYSTVGRRLISEARSWAKQAGFTGTLGGIQRFRAAVTARGDSDPLKQCLASSYDFYSLSQCRDLVFHVQEHTFTCLEVQDLLVSCGLSVMRVDTKNPAHRQAYLRRFPDDPGAVELGNWHVLETENPTLFGGLYSFWLCRTSERERTDSSWIDNTRCFA